MPTWLTLAKGPIFIFVLIVLIFGLLRLFLLTIWDIIAAIRRAGNQRIPYKKIGVQTVARLFPFNHMHHNRVGYSTASIFMHITVLVVSLFLRNHLDILEANIGFSWIAISKPVLDALTLFGILGIGILLLYRLYTAGLQRLSRVSDYLLLLVIINIFLSGFIAGRPWNPIPYNGLMLFHTLNGIALALTTPFSKVAHCVLFPLIRLGTEVSWHFTPTGGSEAVNTLHGSEGRKI